ncbi:hypothetical protein GCM10022221_60610 [Actinocorallia aurea]
MSWKTKPTALAAATTAAVALTASPAQASAPFSASGSLVVKVGPSATVVAHCNSWLAGLMVPLGSGDAVYTVREVGSIGCGGIVSLNSANLPWTGGFLSGVATQANFSLLYLGCPYYGTLTGIATGSVPTGTAVFSNQPLTTAGACPSIKVDATYTFSP